MAYQGIGTGTTPNDNTGDSLFTGAVKINSNFTEIYNALGDGSSINLSKSRTITAGNGLTGGGDLSADRTLNVGQGDGITVSADTVAVDSTVIRTSGGQTIGGTLTVTGNITGNVTGNLTNTVTGTNTTELVRGNMADNDQFRILIGGTASNAGFVEIATADDGTEPIYVRQYTGVFSSVARTATLLDASGNTSFPGNVTVDGNIINGGFDFRLGSSDQSTRGNSGSSRALVKDSSVTLVLNYGGDFTGGVRVDSNLSSTGTITGTRLISNIATGTAPLSVTSTTKVDNLNVDLLDGIDSSRIVFGDNANKTSNNNDWNSALPSGFYEQFGPSGTGTPTENWYHMMNSRHSNTGSNYQMQISGNFFDDKDLYYRIIDNNTPSSWNKIWHSGNDGSGSGLDADLLDGLNSATANTPSTIVARDGSGNFSAGTVTATSFSGNLANTLTLNTSGTGLSGSTTFNNSGDSTFTVTSNATSANTPSTIVARDGSGNFSAGIVTATAVTVNGPISAITPNFGTAGGIVIRANSTTNIPYLQFTNFAADVEYANLSSQQFSYGLITEQLLTSSRSIYINDPGLGGDLLSNGGYDGIFTIFNTSGVVGRQIAFSIKNEELTNYIALLRIYRNGVTGGYFVDCPHPGTTFNVDGTKNFKITHPIDETKNLVHVSIEGPRADLLYRGTAKLVNGTATINLDEEYELISGTWKALCRNPQVWVTSVDGWEPCKGSVTDEILTIQSKDTNCSETVNWLVVAERQDASMYNPSCDENGRPILEPDKYNPQNE
jgi:hypothetical protein